MSENYAAIGAVIIIGLLVIVGGLAWWMATHPLQDDDTDDRP